jgi:hypothetical protein
MRIMVPEDFLVISPQLAHLMVEWLWRERKNKKRSLFSATPCILKTSTVQYVVRGHGEKMLCFISLYF